MAANTTWQESWGRSGTRFTFRFAFRRPNSSIKVSCSRAMVEPSRGFRNSRIARPAFMQCESKVTPDEDKSQKSSEEKTGVAKKVALKVGQTASGSIGVEAIRRKSLQAIG